MTTAIKIDKGNDLKLVNVSISGFEKGISAEDSTLDMIGCKITHNKVGLELINSPTIISNSNISKNDIDIIIKNSPIELINSVTENIILNEITKIINSQQPLSVKFNPFQLKADAKRVLNTQNPELKRKRFSKLLDALKEVAKYAPIAYPILKVTLSQFGIQLP